MSGNHGRVRRIHPYSAEGKAACRRAEESGRKMKLDVLVEARDAIERKRPSLPNSEDKEDDEKSRSLANRLDEVTDFRKWLALFFVIKGSYKVTEKAVEKFGSEERQKLHMEFAEVYSDREREERIERRYEPTKKQMRILAESAINRMIDEGMARELLDGTYIVHRGNWREAGHRIAAVRRLIEYLGNPAHEIEYKDFIRNGLGGLTNSHYQNSPYLALVESGYAYSNKELLAHAKTGKFTAGKLYPWEMKKAPMVYNKKEIRVAAVKWLLWKVGKPLIEVTADDFYENGLSGLIAKCNDSPYLALVESGYAYSNKELLAHAKTGKFTAGKLYPWEMKKAPLVYNKKEIRVAAVKWLLWKTGRLPKEITVDDFYENGLSGVMARYTHSPYLAFVESGHAYSRKELLEHVKNGMFQTMKVYPWEMLKSPSFCNEKGIRIAAVRWLIWKTMKEPKEITQNDFNRNCLGGSLIGYYNGSPYLAFVESGYAYSEKELLRHAENDGFQTGKLYPFEMTNAPHIYGNKKIRNASAKWLLWKTGKEPREITANDFIKNGLGGLLDHYNNSPFDVFFEAGLVTKEDEGHMRQRNWFGQRD